MEPGSEYELVDSHNKMFLDGEYEGAHILKEDDVVVEGEDWEDLDRN